MTAKKTNNLDIPKLDIDHNVLSKKLIIITLIGFDEVLGKKGSSYYRLFCRLIDKSISEYKIARELIIEEKKNEDRLIYFFEIVNHLENCVNALGRVTRTFETAKNDKNNCDNNLFDFVSNETKNNLSGHHDIIKDIRNRIEHIDEDIAKVRNRKLEGGLFLWTSVDYKNININKKEISFKNLSNIIFSFYKFILEIDKNLPCKKENGKYYYK